MDPLNPPKFNLLTEVKALNREIRYVCHLIKKKGLTEKYINIITRSLPPIIDSYIHAKGYYSRHTHTIPEEISLQKRLINRLYNRTKEFIKNSSDLQELYLFDDTKKSISPIGQAMEDIDLL